MNGFVTLELYREHEGDGPVEFGTGRDGWLNVNAEEPSIVTVALGSIAAYEDITIRTIGRPGTRDNKQDCLAGVRIKFADGQVRVIFNDMDPSFARVLERAGGTLHKLGRSAYLERFQPK